MGATNIRVQWKGDSMRQAFDNAVRHYQHEYGHDPYNGAINNCSLIGDKTSLFDQLEDTTEFEEQCLDLTGKREVVGAKVGYDAKNDCDIYMFVGWAPI